MFLAIARELLERDAINREFIGRWVDWETALDHYTSGGGDLEAFIDLLKEHYDGYTMEWAAEECGVPASQIMAVADGIADAGTQVLFSHLAGQPVRGTWVDGRRPDVSGSFTCSPARSERRAVARPNSWAKFKPTHWNTPPTTF